MCYEKGSDSNWLKKKQSKTNEQSSHQENFDMTKTLIVSCALDADSGE